MFSFFFSRCFDVDLRELVRKSCGSYSLAQSSLLCLCDTKRLDYGSFVTCDEDIISPCNVTTLS